MLVLTRKLGEGIAIGDSVRVVVMQIKGKQVRLGIQAEASTPVHREEVYEKIKEENLLAQQVVGDLPTQLENALRYLSSPATESRTSSSPASFGRVDSQQLPSSPATKGSVGDPPRSGEMPIRPRRPGHDGRGNSIGDGHQLKDSEKLPHSSLLLDTFAPIVRRKKKEP